MKHYRKYSCTERCPIKSFAKDFEKIVVIKNIKQQKKKIEKANDNKA